MRADPDGRWVGTWVPDRWVWKLELGDEQDIPRTKASVELLEISSQAASSIVRL